MTVYSQTSDKKADAVKPAREVILKNPGEKDLPQKLKEDQLKQAPVILSDSSINNSKATIPSKKNCRKRQNKNSS